MKKVVSIILLVLVVLLVAIALYLGFEIDKSLTNLVDQEATRKHEGEFLKLFSFDDKEFLNSYDHEEVSIKNEKGKYDFNIETFDLEDGKDIFIFIHGLGGTNATMHPFGKVFLDRGFGTVFYDQMNSGNHPIKKNTMGVKEKEDLLSLISYLENTYPNSKINIFGESYGCHTALMAYPEIKDKINLIIFDSPMANGGYFLNQGFEQASKQTGMPIPMMNFLGNIGSVLREGYSFKDINALDKVSSIDNPILIISNEKDPVTPHTDALAIYDKATKNKEMVLSNSDHALMLAGERDKYIESVDKFLAENNY